MLIDKILELTSYALRFYKLDLCNQTEVEKLLLLNLNQNFTNLRSDFVKPLQLIRQYLKVTKDFGSEILLSADACHFIRNVGINNSNLDQKIISLRLLDKIYSLKKNCFSGLAVDETVKTHDQKLFALYNLTLSTKYSDTQITKFFTLAEQIS